MVRAGRPVAQYLASLGMFLGVGVVETLVTALQALFDAAGALRPGVRCVLHPKNRGGPAGRWPVTPNN
jgi:hypothetical protein